MPDSCIVHREQNLFNLPALKYFPFYGLDCNSVIPPDHGLKIIVYLTDHVSSHLLVLSCAQTER